MFFWNKKNMSIEGHLKENSNKIFNKQLLFGKSINAQKNKN